MPMVNMSDAAPAKVNEAENNSFGRCKLRTEISFSVQNR